MILSRASAVAITAGLLAACIAPAGLRTAAAAPLGDRPVLLSADQMVYDDDLGIVTATGHVEMSQDGRILLADVVNYSDRTNVATASGNVSVLEPDGQVIFGDYVELSDEMRQAFIANARILLQDNSRIAGQEGERVDGRYTRLTKVVYSPCDLCKDDPTRAPLWQIRASRVTHDSETHDITYRNAFLEMMGIPIAWMPYFTHPDPTVDRRSGFLFPGGGASSDLGTYARIYYFFDIDPDKDFTLEVTPSEKDKLLLGGRYRQRFTDGSMEINAAGTHAERIDTDGPKKEFRGYLLANGRFDLSPAWRSGFNLRRTTDNTFLRRYNYSGDDLLTSRAYVEQFKARDYLSFNAYSFQDLRPGVTEEEPEVVPLITYSAMGEPNDLFGGRWAIDANFLSLFRNHGTDTRRWSFETNWDRQFISNWGLVTDLWARARADLYWVNNLYQPSYNRLTDTARLRGFVQSQMTMSYPLVANVGEQVSWLIEPKAAFTAAPPPANGTRIPNEDSLDVELDPSNIFEPSRFPGYDRLEGGQRVTYGLKTGFYGFPGGGYGSVFAGQSFRLQKANDFPNGSGLEEQRSDLVGRIDLAPSPWLDLSYGVQLDDRNQKPLRHDAFLSAGPSIFRVNADYLFISKNAVPGVVAPVSRKEVTIGAISQLTQYWSVGGSHRRDLAPGGGPIATNLALTYQDECLTFQLVAQRDFTRRTGLKTGNSIYFRLLFKNLGEFLSPQLSTSLLGGRAVRP